jgi:hypothetical protein
MPAGRKIPERERPKLAAAIPFIDGILESDRKAPRKQLHGKLETLGDFRRGAVSVNYRKCGKSNCACAQRDHPGHGPQYLWNASVGGKTRTRNLPLGPELEKVEQEVERYREFDRLCQEPVEVNDQICHLHPVPVIGDENEAEQLNKTAEAFRQEAEEEISRLIGRVLGDRQRLGHLDLEASEMAIRAVMQGELESTLTASLEMVNQALAHIPVDLPVGGSRIANREVVLPALQLLVDLANEFRRRFEALLAVG